MSQLVAARVDQQTARTYWTTGRRDAERAFAAAKAHSRLVRVLRVVLPAGVALLLGSFMLWTWFNPMRLLTKLPDNIGDLVINGTKITMEAPRLTGFTREGKPYELTAKAAAQDLTKPDIVELSDLRGKFEMGGQGLTEVTSPNGVYNAKQETLVLGKGTVVNMAGGYRVLLDDAIIETKTSNLVTNNPVQVDMLQGRLTAKKLHVLESGALLRFEGGVSLNLNLGESAAAADQAKQ